MEPIIRILIEDILVFAYCGEEEMADDYSVKQLERIASALSQMEDEPLRAFLEVVHQMSLEASASGESERAQQLSLMPSHLGIA